MKRIWPWCLGFVVCAAADWPQYRGPNRDGTAPGVQLPRTWPKRLEVRWEVPAGQGFSSPVVADGRVFLLAQEGADEALSALDAQTGKRLWRHAWRARYASGLAGTGPRSTPAVDGGRLYAIGATGEMVCLSVSDGALLWQKSFRQVFKSRTPTYGFSPSPLVDGDRVIVHPGGRGGNSIAALDKQTGTVLWTSQDDPPGYASPVLVPPSSARRARQVVVFTELGLVSLDPATGRPFWRYDWQTEYEQNIADPVVEGDLLAITSLSGSAALRLTTDGDTPACREAWRNSALASHFSGAVVREGHVYAPHGRGAALRCLRLADGAVRWTQDLPARQRADIVLADDCLLVYTDTGHLVVVEATPEAYRERARYALAGQNWVPPVLAAGCLFLRDDATLRCVVLPKP